MFDFKGKRKEVEGDDNDDGKNNIIKNHLSIDVDSRKILKLLKLTKMNLNKNKKEGLYISKSWDLLKSSFQIKSKKEDEKQDNFGKTFNNFSNKGKLDKRLLKEIIDVKGSQKLFEKKINKSNTFN